MSFVIMSYIQIHGKALTICPDDDIFLFSGLGYGAYPTYYSFFQIYHKPKKIASLACQWYTMTLDRPIKRLRRNLCLLMLSNRISLPSDSSCNHQKRPSLWSLFKRNRFWGLLISNKPPNSKTATGQFHTCGTEHCAMLMLDTFDE